MLCVFRSAAAQLRHTHATVRRRKGRQAGTQRDERAPEHRPCANHLRSFTSNMTTAALLPSFASQQNLTDEGIHTHFIYDAE